MDRILLPKTTLVPVIEHVPTLDSFKTAQRGDFLLSSFEYHDKQDLQKSNLLLMIDSFLLFVAPY